MIYHIVTADKWEQALARGFYTAESLEAEGFIHASTDSQVAGVLQRYYAGQHSLLLLHIDEQKLTAELKYEMAPSVNEMFPHVYGPINLNAIVDITSV